MKRSKSPAERSLPGVFQDGKRRINQGLRIGHGPDGQPRLFDNSTDPTDRQALEKSLHGRDGVGANFQDESRGRLGEQWHDGLHDISIITNLVEQGLDAEAARHRHLGQGDGQAPLAEVVAGPDQALG